jgi:hypothetical protein
VALLCLEVAVRAVTAFDRNTLDALVNLPPADPGRALELAHLIRPHPDDRVVYELRPNVRGRFRKRALSVNALGMRDVERRWRRPPGVFRIAGIGDSHTFGWGVAQDETFLAVLERRLHEAFPGRRFEVWNLGVPGYNSVQEVRALELRLDRLAPDLVVAGFVSNDADLPNFLARRPDLTTLRKSYLAELVRRRVALLRGKRPRPLDLVALRARDQYARSEHVRERLDERYRPLVGEANMLGAYRRLAALGREHGFPVVVLLTADHRGTRGLLRVAAEEGIVVADPAERIANHVAREGIDPLALAVSPDDRHGNATYHRLTAEVLFETLVARDLLGGGARPGVATAGAAG